MRGFQCLYILGNTWSVFLFFIYTVLVSLFLFIFPFFLSFYFIYYYFLIYYVQLANI